MTKIYKWTPGDRKIDPTDWNALVNLLELEHVHNGANSIRIPESVDTLPTANAANYGRLVKLKSDGKLYFCVPV